MSRFRPSRQRQVPGLNLASLPDLIFTVLFFFMIVTHMRDVVPHVNYEVPQSSEVQKDVRKAGLVYIFIGKPIDSQGRTVSDRTVVQLNNRLVDIPQLAQEIERERASMSESERRQFTVSIRADRDTEMGIINDVKQQLRRAGALRVNYSARDNNKQNNK